MAVNGQLPCLDAMDENKSDDSYYQSRRDRRCCTVRVAQIFTLLQLGFEDVLQIFVAFRLQGVLGWEQLQNMELGNSIMMSLVGSSIMILVAFLKLMHKCCCLGGSGAVGATHETY